METRNLPEGTEAVGAEREDICSPENTEEDRTTSEEEYLSPDLDDEYTPNANVEPAVEVRRSQRQPKSNRSKDYVYSATDVLYEDPLTVEEALNRADGKKWKDAMEEEYSALIKNKTWTLTDPPDNRTPIQNKWVFKRKLGSNGKYRYKARLVIKGFAQRKGIDYTETFAPVIKYNTIRYLLALAVQYDMDIQQMDANTAFLQGELNEEIYMMQPEHYEKGTQVCKLNKSIYGLKQASRVWNIKLDDVLINKIGMKRSKVDSCLYYFMQDEKKIFIAIYVDDLIIFSNNESLTCKIKTSLQSHFSMKDLGSITNCLGFHVTRKESILYLDQEEYVKEILQRFNMMSCNSVGTPVDCNVKLSKQMCPQTEEERIEMNKIPYKEAVGSLLCLSQCTRPDMSYAVNQVCRYASDPGIQHWNAVKRIFRYLKGTITYRLKYEKSTTPTVFGYCDADWASDLDGRKSTTGYVFLKGKCVIT